MIDSCITPVLTETAVNLTSLCSTLCVLPVRQSVNQLCSLPFRLTFLSSDCKMECETLSKASLKSSSMISSSMISSSMISSSTISSSTISSSTISSSTISSNTISSSTISSSMISSSMMSSSMITHDVQRFNHDPIILR